MGAVGEKLSPAKRTRLELSNPDGRYKEGEFLSLNITATPAFDGYLYVDYLDSLGNIVHMLPAPKRTENAVQAGQRITVGAVPSKKSDAIYYYKIEPPHGRNLIVAITSAWVAVTACAPLVTFCSSAAAFISWNMS